MITGRVSRLGAKPLARRRIRVVPDGAVTVINVSNDGLSKATVDEYIEQSTAWPDEMTALRPTLLGCGLVEEIKWAKPCYSHDGANIVILQEMKRFLALMFFKGALLDDPDDLLEAQGPNSRSARRICFTSVGQVHDLSDVVARYVQNAIAVEAAGLEVEPAAELELVSELGERLDRDPTLGAAFAALTPGRQREYNLYFSAAKRRETRESRIDRYVSKILDGRGFRDR